MMMVPDVPGAILEQKLRNKYESLEVLRQTVSIIYLSWNSENLHSY